MNFGAYLPTYLHHLSKSATIYTPQTPQTSTYDHTHLRIRDPVRSPIDKQMRARLVVGWVTTSESLVLYVFISFLFHSFLTPPPPSPIWALALTFVLSILADTSFSGLRNERVQEIEAKTGGVFDFN